MGISVGDKNVTELAVGDKLCEKGYEENAYIYGKSASRVKFSYTGSEQTFTVPKDGTYKLEVRGAAGGTDNRGNVGGRGGYACGTIFLVAGTVLKIYVGEQGKTNPGGLTATAFNGGGRGARSDYRSSNWGNGGGGGGTDIRIGGNTLYHRLIVGGGGGGASPNLGGNNWTSMCGGGEQGNSPRSGAQGTQTDGNAFGVGFSSNCNNEGNRYSCNGGGGGWYGGGKGGSTGSSDSWSDSFYAGGGSGFVRTGQTTVPAGYLVSEDYVLSETQNIKGNESMPNLDGTGTMTGNTGNGCVVISCPFFIPPKEKVTQAGAYHNPDLGLISISSDGENWITMSDKDVGAQDVLEAGKIFQYGNAYGFPGAGDSSQITTDAATPDLTGYEGGNLYSNDHYRTNADWNAANRNLWKGIAFNLKSLERGPCPIGFHIPSLAEIQAAMQAAGSIAGVGTNVTYEVLNQYLLFSHYSSRQGSGVFYPKTTYYLTNEYVNNQSQNRVKALRIYGNEGSETIGIVSAYMNYGGYIRPFRDKAIVPTTGWTRLPAGSGPRLPIEYQEVEYIQAVGAQRIDTGVYAGNNIQTETKISVETTELNHPIFGGSNGGGNYYHCTPYNNKWYVGINNSENNGGAYSNVIGTIYTIVFNNSDSYLNVDGGNVVSVSGTQGQSGTTLQIAGRYNGSEWYYGIYKYYYFKMYNKTSGEYVRDFVPCYRRRDGVIGMYDLVTETFYTNVGTGSFTKGADVNIPELPATYQEVKYVEITGANWIDTLVPGNNNIMSQIKFMALENSSGSSFYGGGAVGDDTKDFRYFDYESKHYLDLPGGSGSGNRIYGGTFAINTLYELEIGNFYIKEVGASTNIASGTAVGTFTTPSIKLGYWDENHIHRSRWYYVKIYESNEMKGWLIPCKRKSDGKVGMFNLVNNRFITESGTGDLACGVEIYYKQNSNTVAFYDFDGNINDVSSNGRNFSMKSGSFTYGTVGGIKYVDFSQNAWTNGISSFPHSTGAYTRSFWMKFPNYSKTASGYYGIVLDFWKGGSGGVSRIENKNGVFNVDGINFTPPDYSKWYHYCIINDGGTAKLYVNATLVGTGTLTVTDGAVTLAFNNAPDTNGSQYAGQGQMAQLICENGKWTEDYLTEYYNSTKNIFE